MIINDVFIPKLSFQLPVGPGCMELKWHRTQLQVPTKLPVPRGLIGRQDDKKIIELLNQQESTTKPSSLLQRGTFTMLKEPSCFFRGPEQVSPIPHSAAYRH